MEPVQGCGAGKLDANAAFQANAAAIAAYAHAHDITNANTDGSTDICANLSTNYAPNRRTDAKTVASAHISADFEPRTTSASVICAGAYAGTDPLRCGPLSGDLKMAGCKPVFAMSSREVPRCK